MKLKMKILNDVKVKMTVNNESMSWQNYIKDWKTM